MKRRLPKLEAQGRFTRIRSRRAGKLWRWEFTLRRPAANTEAPPRVHVQGASREYTSGPLVRRLDDEPGPYSNVALGCEPDSYSDVAPLVRPTVRPKEGGKALATSVSENGTRAATPTAKPSTIVTPHPLPAVAGQQGSDGRSLTPSAIKQRLLRREQRGLMEIVRIWADRNADALREHGPLPLGELIPDGLDLQLLTGEVRLLPGGLVELMTPPTPSLGPTSQLSFLA